jgi:hypothetical protein
MAGCWLLPPPYTAAMTQDQVQRIAEGHERGICPQCGVSVAEPAPRVGSGAISEGLFCSLDCQAVFYEDYYRERIRASRPSSN